MISVEEMKKAVNKTVRVKHTYGATTQGLCTEYLQPADEDEEHNISVKENGLVFEINQSEIEEIKILK